MKKNLPKIAIITSLIFLSIFGCSAMMESFFTSLSMSGHNQACHNSTENCTSNQMQSKNAIIISLELLFSIVVLVALVIIFIKNLKTNIIPKLENYYYKVRDRYGGPTILNKFIFLFSEDILNPKTF